MSKRILLVEDISINAELASIQLSQRGFSVSTAANGKEALRQLQLSPAFNIILMDIQMPIMDGLEATQKIRNIEREKGNNQHLPIIGVSASVMPEEQKAAYKAGMDAFIGKPIDFDMLAQQISELLDEPITETKPHAPATASVPVTIHSPQSTDNLVNFHQGLDNWSSKEKYFNSLKLFVNHYQAAPEQIHALLVKGETKEAKRIVHNLKGVSAHLGLTQLNADVSETDQQLYSETNLLSINLEKLTESLKRTIEAINTFIKKQ
jgi:CheY-like chemotaxis protein